MRLLDSITDPTKPDEVMGYMYLCPGCKMGHMLYIKRPRAKRGYARVIGDLFTFNSNMVRPTFHPRVLVTWPHIDPLTKESSERRCHHTVRAGELVFEVDCTHDLAGKTVKMIVRDD